MKLRISIFLTAIGWVAFPSNLLANTIDIEVLCFGHAGVEVYCTRANRLRPYDGNGLGAHYWFRKNMFRTTRANLVFLPNGGFRITGKPLIFDHIRTRDYRNPFPISAQERNRVRLGPTQTLFCHSGRVLYYRNTWRVGRNVPPRRLD